MKLECEVTNVRDSGEYMTVGLMGRQPNDAEWRQDQPAEIRVTASDKLKRAFYLGRKVTIEISPR